MTRRILLSVAVLLTACVAEQTSPFATEAVLLRSPDGRTVTVDAEIADTPVLRQTGLMFRNFLDEGDGMLFLFENEEPLGFWMKNTLIPLDIAFFDARGQFVSAATMQPCTADPCASYLSAAPSQFALEVPAGFLAEQDIGEGWSIVRP